ncbi:hypothetical protein AtubIFM56815_008815 [Aspergillus tubingensis]|nr:GABA permease, putative [Aspergillus tubingensis]GFN11257.1 GABA permease, putative [Aspergillus tubingensis]GLA58491.1 hypothetical protein AtubIFM54640_007639 [Aspergillus tubingensis]GLA84600.1 hypothetical protein AtubIFM56815_008815 [Aspergillus tubingensis]GLB21606.1 hypothetical protein AtubIFM61612_002154 [Aspergillus tubingensis]
MSSAHLYRREKDRMRYSLEHRTQAISQLASNITNVTSAEGSAPANLDTTALLLSSILLGMTSTWHDVSLLDLVHLKGARTLFQKWMFSAHRQSVGPSPYDPNSSFLVGVMAYWEALASFHVDQNLEAVDYIWDMCNRGTNSEACCPNPLTGVSTSLFISMAQVGTLSRQLRLVDRLCSLAGPDKYKGEMYLSLLDKAKEVEKFVRDYAVLAADEISATGDDLTPSSHLHTMGLVYQLSILLELYRLFPELLRSSDDQINYSPSPSETKHFLDTLATNILTLLVSIPPSSRTKAIQVLPLIIAGSALQGQTQPSSSTSLLPSCIRDPIQGIMSLSSNSIITNYWRRVVMDKITSLRDYVGLDSVDYARRIVEGVWMRADSISLRSAGACSMVSWLDVMREDKLQTLFG